jgi:hypothetical protein
VHMSELVPVKVTCRYQLVDERRCAVYCHCMTLIEEDLIPFGKHEGPVKKTRHELERSAFNWNPCKLMSRDVCARVNNSLFLNGWMIYLRMWVGILMR